MAKFFWDLYNVYVDGIIYRVGLSLIEANLIKDVLDDFGHHVVIKSFKEEDING